MSKPYQTYRYLNRQQRIHQGALKSRTRYNIARVTAREAALEREELFLSHVDELEERDVMALLAVVTQLSRYAARAERPPDALIRSWEASEELQKTMKIVTFVQQYPSLVFSRIRDRDMLGRVRILYNEAAKVAKIESEFSSLSSEVLSKPDHPDSNLATSTYASQLHLSAMVLLITALLTLIKEKRKMK